MRMGLKSRKQLRSAWHDASAEESVADNAERFLLAEYALVSDTRIAALRMVENRITLITGLQASEIALLALLVTSKLVNKVTLLTLVCALAFPTLLLTYNVFLRAVDIQVTQRRYIYALNAIRGHFVTRYPHIKDAVRLPTSTNEPSFTTIGTQSSMLVSMAGTMLIITVTLTTLVAASISWLALKVADVTATSSLVLIPAAIAAGSCCATATGLTMQMRRVLRRAAVNSQGV